MTDIEDAPIGEPDRMLQLIRAVNLVTESNIEIIKRQDRIIELLEASETRDIETARVNLEAMKEYSAENIARLTHESIEKYKEQQRTRDLFSQVNTLHDTNNENKP